MNKKSSKTKQELLGYQTLRLHELISEVVKCCDDRKLYQSQKFGLPFAGLKCLMLFRGQRYLTVKGIAERLEVAKSRVTKIVNGLNKKGLVEQIDDPKDGRIRLISLTPEGQKIAEEVESFQTELHRQILLKLSPEERRNVLSYLEMLRAAMEAVKEEFL